MLPVVVVDVVVAFRSNVVPVVVALAVVVVAVVVVGIVVDDVVVVVVDSFPSYLVTPHTMDVLADINIDISTVSTTHK